MIQERYLLIARLKRFIKKRFPFGAKGDLSKQQLKQVVKKSIKRYKKTYQLLEEYDQTAPSSAEDLAQPRVVQKYLRQLQK